MVTTRQLLNKRTVTLWVMFGALSVRHADAKIVAQPTLKIIDKPIRFDAKRRRLTLAYRQRHEDPRATRIEISPRMIVIHHTGGSSFAGAWRYFNHSTIEASRRRLWRHGRVNVSAHFLIDRNGRVYQMMPETRMARHCIGLNHIAIGIENVGGTAAASLTPAQLESNAKLVRYLVAKHAITHVIGHHEYLAFEGHAYFREREKGYRTKKRDPGPRFMRALRKRIADLALKGVD